MTDIPEDFRAAVSELLINCQGIEEILRIMLVLISGLADHKLSTHGVRFRYPQTHWNRWPMGKLIKAYSFHTDDVDLIKHLNELTEHRNAAAHTIFVWYMINAKRPEAVQEKRDEILAHADKARETFALLSRAFHVLAKAHGWSPSEAANPPPSRP